MIRAEKISKTYDGKTIIKDFSFCFPDKGIIAIIGKSGSGKTTLLRILSGLTEADMGTVDLVGVRTMSMVFQEDRLLKWENALENAAISAEADNQIKNQVYDRARKILVELGLGLDLDTRVADFSGGMARRTAIARALTLEADVYFMDEPIKGLDAENAKKTLDVIKKYTEGKLLIISTHNQTEIDIADIVIDISQ